MNLDINEIIAQVEANEAGIEDADLFADSEDGDGDDSYYPPLNSSRGRGVSTSHFGGFNSEAWREMDAYMREAYRDD